ncbi:MAG TPA: STAS domain-containing protein [Thermoanaerobaculia bacterium]|nr:STAS domain-containing protein [Thermoanaerobaculia bacterium]
MLDISVGTNGEIVLSGRFDAAEAEKARQLFLSLEETRVVDFARLDYISSAGLGVLLAAQKKLSEQGGGLKLVNMNGHIRDVFRFSGFDQIFEID